MRSRFKNREEAGRELARALKQYAGHPDALVLALPRGGVPVAFEVATKLNLPLDIFLVRKLGVPGHEEFAMGAMASGGITFLNPEVVRQLRISRGEIKEVIERERGELERREEAYGRDRRMLDIRDRTLILIDDGLATGSTMKAAVKALREQSPRKIVVAVPVAPSSTCKEFEREADEMVCLLAPELFFAVGEWYEDFSQTTDDEVRDLLRRADLNLRTGVPVTPMPIT